MDTPVFKSLRIAPTTQQGGTQTIQQSIYLTHNNPCGLNTLIFQKMGLTQIRYIDLKNYLDQILDTEEMNLLFEKIRQKGTEYINDPENTQKNYEYLYYIQEWAQASLNYLSVPVDYYFGYRFRINVFDASGSLFYDSYYPSVKVVEFNNTTNLYDLVSVELLPLYPFIRFQQYTDIYKIDVNFNQIPFIGFKAIAMLFSNFPRNQNSTPEVVMDTFRWSPNLNLVRNRKVKNVETTRLFGDTLKVLALSSNQEPNLVLHVERDAELIFLDLGMKDGRRIAILHRLPLHLVLRRFNVPLPIVARMLLDDLCRHDCLFDL